MSKNNLVITVKNHKVYYGYYQDGAPMELYCDVREKNVHIGDIFVARVDRIAEGIHGAFVTIDKNEKAFYKTNKSYPKELIKFTAGHEGKLYGGDLILLQMIKESAGDKLPVVSERISIQSAYFVLSLADYRLSVSKKITQAEEKERLISIMQTVKQEQFGLLARTAAKGVAGDILKLDLDNLLSTYEEIMRKGKIAPGGTLVYRQAAHYVTLAKELPFDSVDEILTDDKEILEELQHFYALQPYSGMAEKIRYYQDSYSLWSLYRMEHYYEEALKRKVFLKSGGSIVIDPTEAMTVIDVNSGAQIKKKKADTIYYQMNIEAADEIARQIRLRNLSGIIMVDFINMKSKEMEAQLLQHLKERCQLDRIPAQVVDLTALGIVEMIRERRMLPLREQVNLKTY